VLFVRGSWNERPGRGVWFHQANLAEGHRPSQTGTTFTAYYLAQIVARQSHRTSRLAIIARWLSEASGYDIPWRGVVIANRCQEASGAVSFSGD